MYVSKLSYVLLQMDILTKGDNNRVDDHGLYPAGVAK